ncbi:MAG TPA: hypothetical protein DEP87_02925 [Candidatus Pacebacteria bacterium]|nr:hypothetical protein [Candidatus Paceibacterota bacterium]
MLQKIVFLFLVGIVALTGTLLVGKLFNSSNFDKLFSISQPKIETIVNFSELQKIFSNPIKSIIETLNFIFVADSSNDDEFTKPEPTITLSPTVTPIIKNTKSNQTKTPTKQTSNGCPIFSSNQITNTVNGVKKTYCFDDSTYWKVYDLFQDKYSAEAFIPFHKQSVEKYQQLYDQTGSSVYLDAKKRSEQELQEEQAKLNEVTAELNVLLQ